MSETKQWSVKYRPKSLETMIGNESTIEIARHLIEKGDSHALLVSGPSGCGKTTLAKIIARVAAEENSVNVQEFNVGADGGKDTIRTMIEGARYMPTKSGRKVFILEEAHGMTKQGAQALLRPLEEPPHNRLLWILVTDKPWMLDVTVSMRCRKLPVDLPLDKELASYLLRIVKKEAIFKQFDDDKVKKACILIARQAGNVPREAVQLLQNVADSKIQSFDDLKLWIVASRVGTDVQMDKIAAQILASIFSPDKVDVAVSKAVKAYAQVDSMGLLSRMLYILHALILFALAGKPNYIIRTILDALGKNKPQIEDMTYVLRVLAKTRNDLREVVVDPSTVILPTILDCIFKMREK